MSSRYIPADLRARVAAQAGFLCGYCLSDERITGQQHEIEHIIPLAAGGLTEEDNLWLACGDCNAHKGDRTTGIDSLTGSRTSLFNPRFQRWHEHFAWTDNGARVIGLTAIGRVTVGLLHLNRPLLVDARRRWVAAGWHPPP